VFFLDVFSPHYLDRKASGVCVFQKLLSSGAHGARIYAVAPRHHGFAAHSRGHPVVDCNALEGIRSGDSPHSATKKMQMLEKLWEIYGEYMANMFKNLDV